MKNIGTLLVLGMALAAPAVAQVAPTSSAPVTPAALAAVQTQAQTQIAAQRAQIASLTQQMQNMQAQMDVLNQKLAGITLSLGAVSQREKAASQEGNSVRVPR